MINYGVTKIKLPFVITLFTYLLSGLASDPQSLVCVVSTVYHLTNIAY